MNDLNVHAFGMFVYTGCCCCSTAASSKKQQFYIGIYFDIFFFSVMKMNMARKMLKENTFVRGRCFHL